MGCLVTHEQPRHTRLHNERWARVISTHTTLQSIQQGFKNVKSYSFNIQQCTRVFSPVTMFRRAGKATCFLVHIFRFQNNEQSLTWQALSIQDRECQLLSPTPTTTLTSPDLFDAPTTSYNEINHVPTYIFIPISLISNFKTLSYNEVFQ